jgi:uncharacterized phage protein (TIGR02218 family)
VRRGENAFTAELRSSAHVFDQQQGRSFQRNCAADLGDAQCKVGIGSSSYTVRGAVVDHSGGVLTADLASAFAPGYFSGGRLIFSSGANNGESLMVKSQSADAGQRVSLTFWSAPAAPASPGDAISLVAGCDKTPTTCLGKFGNIVNFRGFPHMPGNDRLISYAIVIEHF